MDEPFIGIEISDKGVLSINFHIWYSMGSWFTSSHNYKFRYQNQQFELIGYDMDEFHRASGDSKTVSVNFLTKKMCTIVGNIGQDNPVSTQWDNINLESVFTFENMVKPFDSTVGNVHF